MPSKPVGKIESLALAVACGGSVRAWASANDVPLRTAYRMASTNEYNKRVNDIRNRIVDEAVGKLVAGVGAAATRLRTLLDDPTPAAVQLSAARAILSHMIELQSHAELNERITAIEGHIHAK